MIGETLRARDDDAARAPSSSTSGALLAEAVEDNALDHQGGSPPHTRNWRRPLRRVDRGPTLGRCTGAWHRALVRRKPIHGAADAAATLRPATGLTPERCEQAIVDPRRGFQAGRILRPPGPAVRFRLHQYPLAGDTVYDSVEPEESAPPVTTSSVSPARREALLPLLCAVRPGVPRVARTGSSGFPRNCRARTGMRRAVRPSPGISTSLRPPWRPTGDR
jgi:hypothetical protein